MGNLFWLTVLVVVESLQLLIGIIYVNTFFPPTSSMQAAVLPEWMHDLQPEREMLLYRIFILTAVIFQVIAIYWFKSKLNDAAWGRKLRRFLVVESVVLLLLCYVIFKILVYHHPALTQFFWPCLLVFSLSIKTFWKAYAKGAKTLYEFIHFPANHLSLKLLLDLLVLLFIFMAIDFPNKELVLAQMYLIEQFHHFNTLIMVPAFAASKGCLLNVDVNSQYGVGMPMVMACLAKMMGGVTYAHILSLLVMGCILYYWLVYAFLRDWLKSSLIAAIAIVIGIKWQMFDCGMTPNPFIVPNGLVDRFFWDIIYFMLLWRHIQKEESWTLALAAILTGASIVWVSDTGSYMILAFYGYWVYLLAANHFLKGMKIVDNLASLARFLVIPPLVTIILYWLAVGNHIFEPVFWNNIKEFFQFFQDGYESVPVYYALANHRFLDNTVAFIVPAVYMLSLMVISSLIFLRKISRQNAMVLVLCFYGLSSYHYFLNRSTATSYYVQCLPFVFILGFWLKKILGFLEVQKARNILLGLLGFCLFALFTTQEFLVYPGRLNFHRNPATDPLARPSQEGQKYYFDSLFTRIPEALKLPINSLGQKDDGFVNDDDFTSDDELVDFYHQDFDFAQDAALIDRLVPPDGNAAVMSSFDIKLLMQADRKPFFYCFPLLVERPMRMRNFPSTHLHTFARLQRTLDQLEAQKPQYIFMEKIFLVNQVSANFYWWSSDVIALINYVRANYEPYAQGYYLVAMKRKS